MLINYWILPVALLLLWFPRQWLRLGGKVIRGSAASKMDQPVVERDAQDASIKLKPEFSKVRNWVDLARAATGAVAVNYALFAVEPGSAKIVATQILALKAILLTLAVLVQTIRWERGIRLSAPVFFILGLSFGLIGWQSALFACVAVWTCNQVIPSAGVFLLVFAGFELIFGVLLAHGLSVSILLSGALTVIPMLVSGMSRRPLVQLNKSSRRRKSVNSW